MINRRTFLKSATIGTVAASLSPSLLANSQEPHYVGTGIILNPIPELYAMDHNGLLVPPSALTSLDGYTPESSFILPGETQDGKLPKLLNGLDRGYKPGPWEIVSSDQISVKQGDPDKFPAPDIFTQSLRYAPTTGDHGILLYRGDQFNREFVPLNDLGIALLKKKDLEGCAVKTTFGNLSPDRALFDQIKRTAVDNQSIPVGNSPEKAEPGDIIVSRYQDGIGMQAIQPALDLNVRKFTDFARPNGPADINDITSMRASFFQPMNGTFMTRQD